MIPFERIWEDLWLLWPGVLAESFIGARSLAFGARGSKESVVEA